ncbi:hypothetical protein M8J76_002726 [Diaphorina citri]|nr:hypothetical protein M8J76_002726 [Diaphorina citri]
MGPHLNDHSITSPCLLKTRGFSGKLPKMKPVFCLLLILAVAFPTLNRVHARDNDDDDDDDDYDFRRNRNSRSLTFTTTEESDPDFDDDKDPFNPRTLSKSFIEKFDPTYRPGDEKKLIVSGRSNSPDSCNKDDQVRKMVDCLAKDFGRNLKSAAVMNHLRRYIHKKDAKAWFNYLCHCQGIRITKKHVVKIVNCYLKAIPT